MRALSDELSAPLGFVLEGGYDLRALAASVAATMEAARNGAALPDVTAGALAQRARSHYAQWWPVTRGLTDPGGSALPELPVFAAKQKPVLFQKEGRRASTAPLPPASKAPQRLALPPGSLVCNDRREGGRRGAGLMVWREAMALRAFGLETVELRLQPLPADPAMMPSVGIDH